MGKGNRLGWRWLVLVTLAGGLIAGAWLGFVQAHTQPADSPPVWTMASPPRPTANELPVADTGTTERVLPIPPTEAGGAAGATLPPPVPNASPTMGVPVVPAVPTDPPEAMATPALPIPPPAATTPPPGDIQPTTGPQVPASGPALGPLPLPAIPIPPVAEVPKPSDITPQTPKTAEAPPALPPAADKMPEALPVPRPAEGVPPTPAMPPMPEVPKKQEVTPQQQSGNAPGTPPVGSPTVPPSPPIPVPNLPEPSPAESPGLHQSLPPVPSVEPRITIPPAKSDSDLNPSAPGNTLNPSASPVEPVVPKLPAPMSRGETPGQPAKNAKNNPTTPAPDVEAMEKEPSRPLAMPQFPNSPTRDDTMRKLTTHAALAILGGALLALEQAHAYPPLPPASTLPTPGLLVKADSEVEKLKSDLAEANKRIKSLEEQVAKLTEMLTGKKDDRGFRVESDPGAVEEIKRLKDKITKLEDELRTLRTQTALRPTTPPDSKPMGTVKIINDYPIEVSIVINDKSYRVAPNKVLDVEVPAGEFTYQLLQSGAPATRSIIRDKETVRLRIK